MLLTAAALLAACTPMVRLSTAVGGGVAGGASTAAAPSHDGSVVAFTSEASDLVAGDTNEHADVFVRDLTDGTVELISRSTTGDPGAGSSWVPSISADGRYVAFVSDAPDLVVGDTNGHADVFVRDRLAGTTARVSVGAGGSQLPGPSGSVSCRSTVTSACTPIERGAAISGDGTTVVFVTREPGGARSVVAGHDRTTGATVVIAVAPTSGGVPVALHTEVAVDGDADVVAVTERRLAGEPATPGEEVRSTVLRTFDADGATVVVDAPDDPLCCEPDLSGDGRWLALTTREPLDGEDDDVGARDADVFVVDRTTSTAERVSFGPSGAEIDGGATSPSISSDGALVAWTSRDPAFGGPAGIDQAVVSDRGGRRAWVVSEGAGAADRDAAAVISGDGRTVVIESAATNLDLAGDTNGAADLFAHTASIPATTGPPVSVAAGTTAGTVTVTGRGFRPDTVVESLDPDVRITSVRPTSTTRIDVAVTVHPGAVAGPAELRLTNAGPHGTRSSHTCRCLTVEVPAAVAPPPGTPPSVVVVITDDQRADSLPFMPLVDGRDDWARFERSYVELPLCCPARASFLTGRSSLRTGVDSLRSGHLLDETATVATTLDAAGYRTALIGKYLNGYPFGRGIYTPPGWDRFAVIPGGYHGYPLMADGASIPYGSSVQDYSTDVLSAEARAFLRSSAPSDPLLLFLAYTAPHADEAGRTPGAERHRGACAQVPIALPPSFNAVDTVAEPAWMAELGPHDAAWQTAMVRNSCEALRTVDEGVDSVIDELDRLGRLESTYVVLTSDNGYSFGEHRLGGKGHLYEESVRVPHLVRGPDVEPGTVRRLTSNVDLVPTILDWTDVDVPAGSVDGSSYAPTLRGEVAPEPTDVLLRGCRTAAGSSDTSCGAHLVGMPRNWGLRTDRHKYVEYPDGTVQLFDLEADPWELTNLAPDPTMAPTVAALHARLVERRGS